MNSILEYVSPPPVDPTVESILADHVKRFEQAKHKYLCMIAAPTRDYVKMYDQATSAAICCQQVVHWHICAYQYEKALEFTCQLEYFLKQALIARAAAIRLSPGVEQGAATNTNVTGPSTL